MTRFATALFWRTAAALVAGASAFAASPCRMLLADQSDWAGNAGYYLDLEAPAATDGRCKLEDVSLILGVGDGKTWRFLTRSGPWGAGRDYSVTARIGPASAEIELSDGTVSRSAGGFQAANAKPLGAGVIPEWANGAADYLVVQTGLTMRSDRGRQTAVSFSEEAARPLPLFLLAPSEPRSAAWATEAGESLTITAAFKLISRPDPKNFAPYVDRFGQSVYGDWPSKVHSESELVQAAADENGKLIEWGQPTGFDRYGGMKFAGWTERATGFFHVTARNGVWWLITPDGNPCFYIGLDAAPALTTDRTPVSDREFLFQELPPKSPPYSRAWGVNSWGQIDGTEDVAMHTANMIRKYGGDWETAANQLTARRMRAWGFSGIGKWSTDTGSVPEIPVIYYDGVPTLVRHPDIFDPAVRTAIRQSLGGQIAKRKDDPLVVGWSIHNEYDGIFTPDEIGAILKLGGTVPAKRALANEALATLYSGSISALARAWKVSAGSLTELYDTVPTPPDADIEALRRFTSREYHSLLYSTVKEFDPNHLYLGFWIVPGWWVNEEDWRIAAMYSDAVGFDYYGPRFAEPWLEDLIRSTNKPVLLGEFSFPATYRMQRGFGPFAASRVDDDATAGALYREWLRNARQNPFCVGVCWFQYRDQPVGGRGPGRGPDLVVGENFALGLVDVADRPKYDLVEQVRAANLEAPVGRLVAPQAYDPGAPAPSDGGVVSTASYAKAVVPGSLTSVFGTALASRSETAAGVPVPSVSGGVRVKLGGVASPLLYVSPQQINIQVPWEIAGRGQAELAIERDGTWSSVQEVRVDAAAPGLFTMDQSGRGQGAIVNSADGSLAAPEGAFAGARPARRGDYISIYCTGLGAVDGPPQTGATAPLDRLIRTIAPASVLIGGVRVTPLFAGLAPGYVGLYQINARIPDEAVAGDAVPVIVEISGAASNSATIAIR